MNYNHTRTPLEQLLYTADVHGRNRVHFVVTALLRTPEYYKQEVPPKM